MTIGGRATSPAFESYTVEWGRGSNPISWVLLHESTAAVTAGALATWDTTQLTDGTYTLQIRLEDADRGELRFSLPVSVKNEEAAAVADNAPIVEISEPETGDVVSGTVALQGIAFANGIREVNIDVGAGLRPETWTSIRRDGRISVTGPLGSWDTTGFDDGLYSIRLTVRDSRGNIAETRVIVTVDNGQ